nr:hypothetical protein [Acidobacteriota bacterium]
TGTYASQYYDGTTGGTTIPASATSVSVNSGSTISSIDAVMSVGGSISGTVSNGSTGLAGICVNAQAVNGGLGGGAASATDGTYTISGLAAGSYTVQFIDCTGTGTYASQYYDGTTGGTTIQGSASSVSVTASVTTSPISAVMSLASVTPLVRAAYFSRAIGQGEVGGAGNDLSRSLRGSRASGTAQTITFTSPSPSGAMVGGSYAPVVTSDSGLTVSLTIDSSSTVGACSVSAGVVAMTGVGTCTLDANQAGNSTYAAATQVTQSFSIAQGTQTITFNSVVPSNASVGGLPYVLSATSSSGLTVQFSVAGTSGSGVCSVNAGQVSFSGVGNCVIAANQTGNANYAAAPTAQQSFTVSEGVQTIHFSSTPPSSEVLGSTTYYPVATSSSKLPITTSIDSASTSGACSMHSGVVTFLALGTCIIDANQYGGSGYLPASQVQQSIAVRTGVGSTPGAPVAQASIFVTSTSGVVGTPLTLTLSGGSGTGAVTYVVTNAGTANCSITGNAVSATSAGTCTVMVTKAADASYLVAASAATTVTFTTVALVAQAALTLVSTRSTVGTALTLTLSGGSGTGAVTYVVTNAGTANCSITGNAVSATSAGTCTVMVTKAADATYQSASSAAITVTFRATVVPMRLRAIRVNGFVWVGRTMAVTIVGTGFYGRPRITSNEAGSSAVVVHDSGRALVVRVRLLAGSARGWHTFAVTTANGHLCKVNYMVR